MKYRKLLPVLLLALFPAFSKSALAVCPVCTVAVTAGLGLSRYLGIDDTISGLWVGGLILSSSFWLSEWYSKKFKKEYKYQIYVIAALFYLLTILPLYYYKIIGHPYNTLFGIDKLVVGTIIGSIDFLLAVWADKKVRKVKGKQLFPYQKVVFPVASLTILSLILYFSL